MRQERAGKLLRVFVDEDESYGGKPLYAALVEAFRAAGFAGATVFKGIEGYGQHKIVHSARAIDNLSGLPVMVEVVEDEAKIIDFLPTLAAMVGEGLLTLENVNLVRFGGEGAG
jgi:uncharacterized protein